jgi:hypothetical protein
MATTGELGGTRRKWLRSLHRIGYFTTALIAAELLAIAFLATRGWLQEREMRAARIEESRTYEGPLLATGDRFVRGSAIYLFGQLPPLHSLHGDGLRFVASGIGNCERHYEQLADLVWNYMRRFAPSEDLPTRPDWEPGDKQLTAGMGVAAIRLGALSRRLGRCRRLLRVACRTNGRATFL